MSSSCRKWRISLFYKSIKDYIQIGLDYTKQNNNGSTDIFVKDIPNNMAYNAVMVTNRLSGTIKLALLQSIFMIINNI